ncbi:MAG: hypothetical protein HY701_00360 [Gemmatimonadetes bacterium]|nr:hypothetical protein [Gemmatimonadota bacterium]
MKLRLSPAVLKVAAVAAIMVATAACFDLDIANPNEPDRDRALREARDVESLIGGTFATWWEIKQGRAPGRALSQSAEVYSSSAANYFAFDLGFQPRQPVVNQIGYQWGYPVDDPWMLLNRALSAIRDALQVIEGGLKIGPNGADTPRAVAFAKFMQGVAHGFIAKLYDKGFIIDEDADVEASVEQKKLPPYGEVMAAARRYLAEARAIASKNSFSTPSVWMGRSYTSQDLVRLTHSYEARFMASVARTPQERAAVNWNEVLSHIQQGITSDFGINVEPGGRWTREYKGADVVSLRFVGPSDQSGGWQAWEKAEPLKKQPFHVETDDRRIHAAGKPQSSGRYLEIPGTTFGDAQRGVWFLTPYRALRWRNEFIPTRGFGFATEMSVTEMDFLRAEAYIRLGRPADALPIINKNRVAIGELPPATVNGVSGPRCVPRTVTGACGDLLTTLLYEKQLETIYLSAGLDYWDQRGFGWLRKGTHLQFPIPAAELEVLKLPVYTFGGVGGTGAAPGRDGS